MARWSFVRHAESVANQEGWLAGRRDVPLSAVGEEQARELARRLAPRVFTRIYTSPLSRARATAAAIARGRRLELVEVDALIERDVGTLEGHSRAALRSSGQMEVLLDWHRQPPGGESQDEVARRVLTWLWRAEARVSVEEHVLVVAHGGVLRCAVGLLDGRADQEIGRWAIANAELLDREIEPGRWGGLVEGRGWR